MTSRGRSRLLLITVALFSMARPSPNFGADGGYVGEHTMTLERGKLSVAFDAAAANALHWRFAAGSGVVASDDGLRFILAVDPASRMELDRVNSAARVGATGTVQTVGGLLWDADGRRVLLARLRLASHANGLWSLHPSRQEDQPTFMTASLSFSLQRSDDDTLRLLAAGDIVLTNAWAAELGVPAMGGMKIGSLILDARAVESTDASALPGKQRSAKKDARQAVQGGVIGPDILVSNVQRVVRYIRNPATAVTAYSLGTTACNVGDLPIPWEGLTTQHPVVGQHLYRLKDGRFEQIGMSWVKHGIEASSSTRCDPLVACQFNQNGLGPFCRDAYNADLNGFQANMGPRYEVNATTGEFSFPFGVNLPPTDDEQDRRLQVHDSDMDPAFNAGALYFVEGQYVSPDDAMAGNQANNVAHRIATVQALEPNPEPRFDLLIDFLEDPTQGEPAITAWQAYDTDVGIEAVDLEGDGRFLLGHKVTDLGGGMWQYEYALHNLYSDRSAQSFGVPIPPGSNVSNVGFHDVDSHSGSPISNIDWTSSISGSDVSWATETFADNPNANALRWGTLYNFRFRADTPPARGCVTVGLFKPGEAGEPDSFEVSAMTPLGSTLEASSPPNDAIDARQPSDVDGTNPSGWQELTLSFSSCASAMRSADFAVSKEGGVLPPPTITAVQQLGGNTIRILLSDPIEPRAWTTVSHASGASVRLGYLPGDVNSDGTANPALDLGALIDCLNQPGTCEDWQANIDRSGATAGVLDITRLIDLFNGAGAYESFTGARLP